MDSSPVLKRGADALDVGTGNRHRQAVAVRDGQVVTQLNSIVRM